MKLFLLLLLLSGPACGEVIASASDGGITVNLTDEPCKLDAVKNLPKRATWTERGRTIEGCYMVHPGGVVAMYWSDLSVVVAPANAFQRATSI